MKVTVIPTVNGAPGTIPEDLLKGLGGARGLMVIVIGNGHVESSSNPGRD